MQKVSKFSSPKILLSRNLSSKIFQKSQIKNLYDLVITIIVKMKTVEVTSSHPGSKNKKLSQRKAIIEYKVDLKRTLSARQIQIHSMLKILL